LAHAIVQTVRGGIDPTELRITQPHEHLLIDLVGQTDPSAEGLGERNRWDEPITLNNYYEVRRHIRMFRDNLQLTSVEDAIQELSAFSRAGGSSIVDLTTIDLGRDAQALRTIARATDIHIVMGTSYYVHDFHPPELASMSEGDIAEGFIRDLTEGTAGGIRAGIIGEVGLTWPVHPDESKVLAAAVRAQLATRAAISIHPGRHTNAPAAAIEEVERAGGDPNKTVVGHVDRTLFELDDVVELARHGCYVEFDLFGQEASYYDLSSIDMPNDARRIDLLLGLMERGFGDQLLVSQDICRKAHLQRFGGEGYGHLLSRVVPLMRRKGMTESDIERILVLNPARVLSIDRA
jgi:phosphotriesterase-related protein